MPRKMCPRCGLHPTYNYRCIPCGDIDRAAAKVRREAWDDAVRQRRAAREALGIEGFRKREKPELNFRAAVWRLTRAAIKNGLLRDPKTLNCTDCQKQAECYDHRDYSKPLEVEPVCLGCNSKRRWGFMPPRVTPDQASRPTEARAA